MTDHQPTTPVPAPRPQSAADRLFPSSAPPVVAAPAPTPAPQTREDVERDITNRLFGSTAYLDELPNGALPDADMPAWRAAATALQATSAEATQFMTLAKLHAYEQPGPEQSAAWLDESKRLMETRGYDANDLAGARQLLRRDLKVFAAVERLGIGSEPRLVEKLILRARQERIAGRLK